MTAWTSPEEVFDGPDRVVEHLLETVHGLVHADVRRNGEQLTFTLTLDPWAELQRADADAPFPREVVEILVPRAGPPLAIPVGNGKRSWKHRNGDSDLCLWFTGDPRELRWEWSDGLVAFVTITHRHLLYEEYARRDPEGRWPVEDAPHGAAAYTSEIQSIPFRLVADLPIERLP